MPEWKVLLTLAYDGQRSMYAISKIQGITYPGIHRVTKSLEKLGFVKMVRKQKSKKNVIVKIYGLTTEGLLWVFCRIPKTIYPETLISSKKELPGPPTLTVRQKGYNVPVDLKNDKDIYLHLLLDFDIDNTARNNTQLLPLIFTNWELHKSNQIAQDLFEEFPEAAFSTLREYYHGSSSTDELDTLFAHEIYHGYLERIAENYARLTFKDERDTITKQAVHLFIASDELQKLLTGILKEIEEDFSNNLRSLRSLKQKIGR